MMHCVLEATQTDFGIMSNSNPPAAATVAAKLPAAAMQPSTPAADRATRLLATDEDQQAIAQTLHGDLASFNRLVVKYQGFAYSIAYRILQSREAAADAVQESLLKAYRSLGTFNGGSFKSWLAKIVVNSCYDAVRQNRHLVTETIRDEPDYDEEAGNSYQLHDTHESPQAYVERMELRNRLELGLRALPYEQRVIVTLADIHGYPYGEISEVTGLPLGTIKSRISRARVRLRDFLLEEPELLPSRVIE